MRIQRHTPLYTYHRKSRRGMGCIPFTLLSGLVAAGLLLSWGWLSQRLVPPPPPTPDNKDLSAARQAFDEGDLQATIDKARRVYAANPDRIDALTLLIRALVYHSYSDYNTGIYRELALETTNAAQQHTPNQPDLMALHAFALHANRRPTEAFQLAQRVIDQQENHTLARLVRGLAYGSVGSFDNANREHQATLALGDEHWTLDILRALALSQSDLGRYQDAASTIDNAIRLNGQLPFLYFERALYAMQIGDASAATSAYFEVLARAPENVKARLRMCELSSTLREREIALRYCQQVTELAPNWADGWHKLGREYFLQSDYAAAQQALNRCTSLQVMQNVDVEERRFECWYLQGQAAEINGDCAALLATYNEFRAMTAEHAIPQTWVYPPEGPPGCETVVS